MLHNKVLWLMEGILLIGAISLFVTKNRNEYKIDQKVEDTISVLKQGDDRSRECEVFDKLIALSSESKKATLMVAQMYARGICKPCDLEQSMTWYHKADLSDPEVGRALFDAAEWEISSEGNVGLSKDQILCLLRKSQELGYKPSKNELDRVGPEYAAVFRYF